MDRQEGYYWVKHPNNPKHEIAEFIQEKGIQSSFWCRTMDEGTYNDSDFEHINEIRIKEPGELPEF